MPSSHARLSPSDAARWTSCPASISLDETLPAREEEAGGGAYAEEGSCAHDLAEIKASLAFGLTTKRQFKTAMIRWANRWPQYSGDEKTVLEMEEHTSGYMRLLKAIVANMRGPVSVSLEQKLETGIPGCWGTSDAVIADPWEVHVVDFKYGAGVAVDAYDNPQLKLYAMGALRRMLILGTVAKVSWTIHQPRRNSISTDSCSADELLAWRDEIAPIAAEALQGSDRFGPSDKACRWCVHSGSCKAQAEWIFGAPFDEGPDPRLLSPEERADYIPRMPRLVEWLKKFEESTLAAIYSGGVKVPGWKVVKSGGQRKVQDPEGALTALRAKGYEDEDILNTPAPKIKGIVELEALLGKPGFREILGPYVEKTEGRPSLAPDTDERPNMLPAAEAALVFSPIEENEEDVLI